MTTHRRVGVTIILILLSMAAVVIVSPGDSSDTNAIAVESKSETVSAASAMRATIDPETGELTVGVAPLGEIELDPDTQNALRTDTEGLVQVYHADGSVSVDMQGRMQSVSVVHIDENGVATFCTQSTDAIQRAANGSAAPTTPEVK